MKNNEFEDIEGKNKNEKDAMHVGLFALCGMSNADLERALKGGDALSKEEREAVQMYLATPIEEKIARWKKQFHVEAWKSDDAEIENAVVEKAAEPGLLEKVAKGVLTLLAFAELPILEGKMGAPAMVLSNVPKGADQITGPGRVLDLARLCDKGKLKTKVPWAPRELIVTRVPVPRKPSEPPKVRYIVTAERPGKGEGTLRVVLSTEKDRDEVTLTPKMPNRVFTKLALSLETAVAFGIILEKGGGKR